MPFQFLIGSLKTGVELYEAQVDLYRFQFLIGSLKTDGLLQLFEPFHLFQFLIGSLKTLLLFFLLLPIMSFNSL